MAPQPCRVKIREVAALLAGTGGSNRSNANDLRVPHGPDPDPLLLKAVHRAEQAAAFAANHQTRGRFHASESSSQFRLVGGVGRPAGFFLGVPHSRSPGESRRCASRARSSAAEAP
jgi:hypothetical protein